MTQVKNDVNKNDFTGEDINERKLFFYEGNYFFLNFQGGKKIWMWPQITFLEAWNQSYLLTGFLLQEFGFYHGKADPYNDHRKSRDFLFEGSA